MSDKMKEFLIDLIYRTMKTIAETAVGIIGTNVFIGEVNWKAVLSASALSGIVCILINLKNLPKEDVLSIIMKYAREAEDDDDDGDC